MVRIKPEQIPIFVGFHEKYTQTITESELRHIPSLNYGEHDFILNFSDYLAGCLSVDCYSKYSKYVHDTFVHAYRFMEDLAVAQNTINEYYSEFCSVMELFLTECCFMSIWLNTFLKAPYRECCAELAASSAGSAAAQASLAYADKVNSIRVIPTLPTRLISALKESSTLAVEQASPVVPTQEEVLELLGWYPLNMGELCFQNTEAFYNSISPQACAEDEYSAYMFSVLRMIKECQETGHEPKFISYNLGG